jgi:hypothetical protein
MLLLLSSIAYSSQSGPSCQSMSSPEQARLHA